MKQRDLTKGSITGNLMLFALPLMAGNLLQQCYNIADTLIVGRYLGANALAAVGSSYTLMTFLTSILIGMCMGSSAVFSIRFGEQDHKKLKEGILHSFGLIAAMTVVINVLVYAGLPLILKVLQVPAEVVPYMRTYLLVIFAGISATFLYNYFAALLRAVGNSVVPLIFLAVSTVLNIVLDLLFVLGFGWGVAGAAGATVLAQFVSGIGITVYTLIRFPEFRLSREELHFDKRVLGEIAQLSFLTCLQQSYELWNPHGPGPGKQLWNRSYGSICSSGKNRFFRLHAGTGFWKCIFHLHCPKLRRRKRKANFSGNQKCGNSCICILPGDQRSGLCICRAAYGHFCKCIPDGDYFHWCRISAN